MHGFIGPNPNDDWTRKEVIWKCGRAADCASLENWKFLTGLVGSNPTASAESNNVVSPGKQLLNIIEQFIEKHNISCPEAIYQTDSVLEDAGELIEQLCDIVGYVKLEEDE